MTNWIFFRMSRAQVNKRELRKCLEMFGRLSVYCQCCDSIKAKVSTVSGVETRLKRPRGQLHRQYVCCHCQCRDPIKTEVRENISLPRHNSTNTNQTLIGITEAHSRIEYIVYNIIQHHRSGLIASTLSTRSTSSSLRSRSHPRYRLDPYRRQSLIASTLSTRSTSSRSYGNRAIDSIHIVHVASTLSTRSVCRWGLIASTLSI